MACCPGWLHCSSMSRFRRCQTIPYPRNPAFFGRNDILQAISVAFEGQTLRPASVAIWGTGGIGKTHIALEFAHRLWLSGEETILWISSETTAEVSKSFNDAAKALELEKYSAVNTPRRNRQLVFQWLQHTGEYKSNWLGCIDVPWLLVLDNVGSYEAVIQNWPTVGNGKVLVTCRNTFVAEANTIAIAIEVPAFTVAQSTEMIHKIINKRSVPGGSNQLEEDATNQLSVRLGGLPLAIDTIAKQIKLSPRFKSVAGYLVYYGGNQEPALKRRKRGGEDPWYPRDLHNLWQPAFDKLSEDATELMGMICFMHPEAIPSFLFHGKDWSMLRPRWESLEDEERVEEATNILLESALVGINNETGTIAVHRLIQDSYFLQMTAESRLKSFHSTLTLLRTHFPSQESDGVRHFYTKWDLCARLHQHIVAFRDRCQSGKCRGTLPTNEPAFIDLIRDDAWYMVETEQFLQAETALLSILGDLDKGSLLAATIQRGLLGLYERTGRSVKACAAAEIEFEILEKHGVSEGNDAANAKSNVGYARTSALRAAEGLKYLDAAVAIARSYPEPECYEDFNIDRFLRNRGRCKMQLKQFDEALRDFDEAEYFQDKVHGPDSHYHGETKHERSKIAAWRGNLTLAAQLSREAHALVSAGKPTHASVMAALYRQGWIAMLQGDYNDDYDNYNAALQLFEKALAICQLNEPHRGNAGESARVWWRMAQVYERKGMEEEWRLRDMAERVRRELVVTGDYVVVKGGDDDEEEEAGWDALVGLLYR
ncbi:P-loop containing nucleoside triphosphate hydrolase protein [Chaetomium fimeti]|uniref:P-loop containing nucleoside triphosphate hydrolase protein n=1 Tax=Chaetomium fimeti TaxID=1854472 RepID=A0AAE0HES5_9PEZI|nr:P-loop containing nucleoside triphosphate hydrolase protein [Chaetomium fimeti]